MKSFLKGIVILIGSVPFSVLALPNANCILQGGGVLGWQQGIKCAESVSELENTRLFDVITAFMMWILGLIGVIAIIAFAIAGILYLTSVGDQEQIDRAKKTMRYAVYGIILALSGVVILTAIEKMLRSSNTF